MLIRLLRSLPVAAALLAVGGLAWGIASIPESVHWVGPSEDDEWAGAGYGILTGIEELLEISPCARPTML